MSEQYVVYVIDTVLENKYNQSEMNLGKYRLVFVRTPRIFDTIKGEYMVIMNSSSLPNFEGADVNKFIQWLQNIDENTQHLYHVDHVEFKGDKVKFKGSVQYSEEAIDKVHPIYLKSKKVPELDSIPDTQKELYLTQDEIKQSLNTIKETLNIAFNNNAQDIFLLEGEKPYIRTQGYFIPIEVFKEWTIQDFNVYISMLMNIDKDAPIPIDLYDQVTTENGGTLDLHADFGEYNLRCHLYRAFPKSYSNTRDFNAVINIRIIPKKMPVLDELNLPHTVKSVLNKNQGLLLISGRGSDGKSTTVAGIINEFNHKKDKVRSILTIEQPVEFVHENNNAFIIQRRIGVGGDSESYRQATNDAMREDTDIVVIQELQEQEEMHNALRLAEIGKLVIATIHANSIVGTIERFINEFDANEKEQIRHRLYDNLLGIIHQNLFITKPPRDTKGRSINQENVLYPLASTFIIHNDRVRNKLKECKNGGDIDKMFREIVKEESSRDSNSVSYDEQNLTSIFTRKDSLAQLQADNKVDKSITLETLKFK